MCISLKETNLRGQIKWYRELGFCLITKEQTNKPHKLCVQRVTEEKSCEHCVLTKMNWEVAGTVLYAKENCEQSGGGERGLKKV